MPRQEHDEWDIASGVGLTALAVASGRAIESKRVDALAVDPYADALVTAADAGVPTPTRLPHPGLENDQQFEEIWSQTATGMGIRTRFLDEFFAAGWHDGITQTVLLASGLDTRAWRLPWPADSTVFEIDQPQVLAFKDKVFANMGVEPVCTRQAVPVDLRDDWPTALEQAGFDRSHPTAWLAEGLLPYLPGEAENRLLCAVHHRSAPGSRIAFDHVRSPHTILDSLNDDRYAHVIQQFGVNIADLFYDNQTRTDPDQRLANLDWNVTIHSGSDLAAAYGRDPDTMLAPMTQPHRYITARLPQ